MARKDCSGRKKKTRHDDEPACHLHGDDRIFFVYLLLVHCERVQERRIAQRLMTWHVNEPDVCMGMMDSVDQQYDGVRVARERA